MPASTEFVALCRAQIALLTQGLGASLSVVYLTQELVEGAETQLVPVAAYPEVTNAWQERSALRLPLSNAINSDSVPSLIEEAADSSQAKLSPEPFSQTGKRAVRQGTGPKNSKQNDSSLVAPRQIVLPLIYEEGVLGLLVTERDDRSWTVWEESQIQQIANTLAIACVLDQRYQWLDHNRRHQRMIQAQQHDILDNLLHQFRNSLTALQTFSKLILKRLLPGDANREIAASIAREATRLRELSQQLESAATGMEADDAPLSLPPVSSDWQPVPQDADSIEEEPQGIIPLLPAAGVLVRGESLLLEPCSLMAILEPLLASAKTIAQERSLSVQATIPTRLPPLMANVQALREVLNNLIENALKYTPAGGKIEVQVSIVPRADSETKWLEIAVSDTGPGIPPQDLPHIFERRFRGEQANSGIPGSGLGLAIARTLVEQMRGEIQVFSPARTNNLYRLNSRAKKTPGATFVVRLPISEE